MEAVLYNFKNKFKNGGRVPSSGGVGGGGPGECQPTTVSGLKNIKDSSAHAQTKSKG